MVTLAAFKTFLAALPALLPFILALSAAVGATGSAVEELGKWRKWPGVTSFGQKLEAIGTDVPKLVPQLQVALLKLQAFLSKAPALPLLVLTLALGGCAGSQAKVCNPADAGVLTAAYAAKVHAQCQGFTFDDCPARPALEAELSKNLEAACPR